MRGSHLATGVVWVRSQLAFSGRTIARYVRNSYLYRWVTTVPESEMIVVELRESYTVRPFIQLFDRVAEQGDVYWSGSMTKRVIDRITDSAAHRLQIGLNQLLIGLLEPPSRPTSESEDEDQRCGEEE